MKLKNVINKLAEVLTELALLSCLRYMFKANLKNILKTPFKQGDKHA